MRLLPIIILIILTTTSSWSFPSGQQNPEIDSLKKVVQTLPDQEKASVYNRLFVLSGKYKLGPEALEYAQRAKEFAEAEQDSFNLAFACRNIGFYYNSINAYDKALPPYRIALDLLKDGKDLRRTFSIINEMTNLLTRANKYDEASALYFEAIAHADKKDYQKGLFQSRSGLGALYRQLGEREKAEEQFEQALVNMEISDELNPRDIATLYRSFGLLRMEQARYDEAMNLFEKSLEAQTQTGDDRLAMMLYNSMAMVYEKQADHELASHYYLKALDHGKVSGDQNLISAALLNVGAAFMDLNQYEKARNYLDEGLKIANEYGFTKWQRNAHDYLKSYHVRQGNYKKALDHLHLYYDFNDSLKIEENRLKLAELEKKYETEKKEKQIVLLNKENEINSLRLKQNRKVLLITVILAALILLSGLNYVRFTRQKQKSREIIAKQETEKKVLSTVIATEDRERKRFAADLHDGLGPLLSSVKLYLSGIEGVPENKRPEMIATATELIDQSIQTTRIISNNILPVELSEKGLIASIRSFCNKIRQSQQMDFEITDRSGGISLEPSTEIILYRVIQELINNTIKHAHAKKILLHFEKTTTGFKIDYRDDGVGFDHQETFRQSGSGMGLANMQERIDSLGGQIEFSHNEPNGTRVFVNLDL